MRAVERRPGAAAPDEIDLDLEHEAAGAVARQELLDRLGALAALPGRADTGIEGDQGDLEIATRKPVAAARAEVAADGGLGTDLEVAHGSRRAAERLGRVGERLDRGGCADVPGIALLHFVESRAAEQQRPLRAQAAGVDLGHQDRAAADHGHVLAVSKSCGGLLGGGWEDDVESFSGHGVRFYFRDGHAASARRSSWRPWFQRTTARRWPAWSPSSPSSKAPKNVLVHRSRAAASGSSGSSSRHCSAISAAA